MTSIVINYYWNIHYLNSVNGKWFIVVNFRFINFKSRKSRFSRKKISYVSIPDMEYLRTDTGSKLVSKSDTGQ